MGFILLLLFICLLIAFIVFASGGDSEAAAAGFLIPFFVSAIVMLLILWNSYDNAVVMQERLVAIEQYSHTIKAYSKHGVAEFKANGAREITDLKYQNYQDQIGRMIVDLRDQVNRYNTRLIGKNVMDKNWFWSWCIIPAPEGSVILKMSDYIE